MMTFSMFSMTTGLGFILYSYKKGMQIQRKYCILIYYAFVNGIHDLKGCRCILGSRGKDLGVQRTCGWYVSVLKGWIWSKGIMGNNGQKRGGVRWTRVLLWIMVVVLTTAAVCLLLYLVPDDELPAGSLLDEQTIIRLETEPDTSDHVNVVPRPEIDEQLLTINEYSRPGTKVKKVKKIVIHYLGNPKTTAQENHDYFESLKDLKDVSMSSNFVIGIEGEIIECVPAGEIAYASNEMNDKSVSIENCHIDESGRFTEATYESCVHLTAYLVEEFQLDREDIIRHYDVTGKECPLYYVENEDKWEKFRDDVMEYIEECRKAAE